MLAIRFAIFATCVISGVVVTHGQAPLTDPALGTVIEPVRVVPPTQMEWSPPPAVLINDPLKVTEITEVTSELIEPMPACACGQPKCPGVCRDPGHPKKPKLTKPGDRNRGDCPPYRYRISDDKRAGNPQKVAPWAACSVNQKYSAWFVGGGSPFRRGRCRKPSEGTWGLDYGGFFGYAKVWLNYTRGRNQGGEGAYETDGEPEFVTRTHEFLGIGH